MPGSPTTYLVDGQPQRDDARQEVTVQARTARRRRSSRARARSTRPSYGPVFTSLLGLPLFPWTPATAYALGDANAANFRLPQPLLRDQPGAEHRASSTRSSAATRGSRGSTRSPPTRRGTAYYADIGDGPARHRREGRALQHDRARRTATFSALGLPVLDGSRAACALGQRPGRRRARDLRPGADAVAVPRRLRDELQRLLLALEPRAAAGGLRRGSSATSARSARCAPAPACGSSPTSSRRAPFTRRIAPGRGLQQPPATRGELMRDDLVARRASRTWRRPATCSRPGTCATNLDSRARCCSAASCRGCSSRRRAARRASGARRSTPNDPVNTPRDLNTEDPRGRGGAARRGHRRATGSARALDVTLREVQFEQRGDEKIPIHGGPGDPDGDFNAINVAVGRRARATRTSRTARAS